MHYIKSRQQPETNSQFYTNFALTKNSGKIFVNIIALVLLLLLFFITEEYYYGGTVALLLQDHLTKS